MALMGELHVASGAVGEGVELLRQSLPRVVGDGSGLYGGAAAVALVHGLAAQGQLADALASIQSLIAAAAGQGQCWDMPELLRVRGELLARSGDLSGAERDLLAAMDLADQQSALSWKLRAAISRARLARTDQATALAVPELRRAYARFVEGFETADLRTARDLLEDVPSTDDGHGLDP
jgi:hypothetical protein